MDKNTKFDFDDILIVPSEITEINSRKQIAVFDKEGMLPIFTAPMDTVISEDNLEYFKKNNINTIIPRTEFSENGETDITKIITMLSQTENWVAVGLEDFNKVMGQLHMNLLTKAESFSTDFYICIDIANGHLQKLHDSIRKWKPLFPKMHLMTGNIANPKTYELLSNIGVEFIRVGVGAGSGCLTSQNVSIGYPMASLINECYKISCRLDTPAKIVADGGFNKYSDIIKALNLGADQIMLGGVFNKALESCADTFMGNIKHEGWTEPGKKINQYDEKYIDMLKSGARIFKKYRGMSTKEVQAKLKKDSDIKTSEGIVKMNQVEYTLDGWTENFIDYLKSAMSYCNCKTLDDFVGKEQYVLITNNALERFKK